MDELEKQHLEELKGLRATMFELQAREKELVMILNTVRACRQSQTPPTATPEA